MHGRHRLRSGADFSGVTRAGVRVRGDALTVYALKPGASGVARVGFSTGRSLGKAVVRNRTRRRLRAAIRPLLVGMAPCDVVVIAHPSAADQPTTELARMLEEALAATECLSSRPRSDVGGTMGAQNPSPDVTEGTSS